MAFINASYQKLLVISCLLMLCYGCSEADRTKQNSAAQTAFSVKTTSKATSFQKIDIEDTTDNIETYLRIISDLSGVVTYRYHTGRALAVPQPGRLAEDYVDFVALKQDRIRRMPDGTYQHGYRGVILFTDLETGEVLETFENSLTGKHNQVEHYATSKGSLIYKPDGSVYFMRAGGELVSAKKPFGLEWTTLHDDFWITYEERFEFRDEEGNFISADNTMYRYFGAMQQLQDPSITSLDMVINWASETAFWPWMDMQGYQENEGPGHLIFGSMGTKYKSLDELPKKYVDAAEKHFPGHLSIPVDWSEYDMSQLK